MTPVKCGKGRQMLIDMHSHVLPNVDDGSTSVEESVAMLCAAAKQGIQCVVATPHFYAHHDNPERFLSRRAEAYSRLQDELDKNPGLPEVKLGAEVYFYSGMSDSEVLQRLTIDKKGCILVEMPQSPWNDRMYRELEAIRTKQGLIPIIAHVDRYISRFRTFGIPEKLKQLPVLVQGNASFFLHHATSPIAMRMLQRDQIQLLGSDCHDMKQRPPRLGDAVDQIRQRLGDEVLMRVEEYQASVFEPSLY